MRVGAGVADRWPNKGAVAVGMQFGSHCRVVFIVAHLAANEERLQSREDDWRLILRRLERDDLLSRGADNVISVPLFHRYEHVFVLGDLNYRVVAPGSSKEQRVEWVKEMVNARDWRALIAVDQLTKERLDGNVFADFEEADITFAPTFKINPQTGQYSTHRIPSYCDRILWHSLPARVELVKCLQYQALTDFKESDHIPVYGAFELRVPALPSPAAPMRPPQGYRIVLEFMLVRFIKGARPFVKRDSFEDAPHSMRRITTPHRLKSGSSSKSFRYSRLRNLMERIPVDENEDIVDEEQEEDIEDVDEDVAESSSSLSSEDPDDFSPIEEVPDESPDEGYEFQFQEFVRQAGFRHFGDKSSSDSYGYNTDLLRTSRTGGSRSAPSTPSTSNDMAQPGTENEHPATHLKIPGGRLPKVDAASDGKSDRAWVPSPEPHANSGPRKRDSLSRQVSESVERRGIPSSARRPRLNTLRMEVHGQGLFLKRDRIYSISIPRRNSGSRERIGDTLPVIPLQPVKSLDELKYRHILLEFAKKKSRVGKSGVLPMRELLPYAGELYAFEMALTKYGRPVATVEACVQMTVSDSELWVDARGRVINEKTQLLDLLAAGSCSGVSRRGRGQSVIKVSACQNPSS
ncbi:Inositol polyphosphate-related phosphatase [Gracilaria domingensis]|nr:Inositol polyphosphate-related phosphatase [Gracilaria domingensis]